MMLDKFTKKLYILFQMTTVYNKLVSALNSAINSGKVLDVSKLQINGTGFKTHDMPKTATGDKKCAGNFPVISDNYASYLTAMKILGPEYLPYAEEYLVLHGNKVHVPKVAKLVTPGIQTKGAILTYGQKPTVAILGAQLPVATAQNPY